MKKDPSSAALAPSALEGEEGVATAPTVYLSARGQDTVMVAAVVKARLESQGCLVSHGGAEVRTRSQCARHYGPLLHDCDVFIQLIGVDPGPVLSSDDGDDGFWSLQVWEAREAAKRRKPARHYLLDDDFCRMMAPNAERPSHVLKKQARHRRKLASSPTKVRQVRDADELLRMLPVIRLAGGSPENHLPSAKIHPQIPVSPAAAPEEVHGGDATSHDGGRSGPAGQVPPTMGISPEAPFAARESSVESAPDVFSMDSRMAPPPVPALPSPPEDRGAGEGVGNLPAQDQATDSPEVAVRADNQQDRPAEDVSSRVLLLQPVAGSQIPNDDAPTVHAPPSVPSACSADEKPSTGAPATTDVAAEGDTQTAVHPACEPAAIDGTQPVSGRQSRAIAEEAPVESADAQKDSSLQDPTTFSSPAPSAGEKVVFAGEQPVATKAFATTECFVPPREKIEIEVRPGRVEIVAQAPMKLELCRAAGGHRLSVRPYALERRGLPRRGMPAWMTRKSAEQKSPVRPVPGRRAYANLPPSQNPESQEESAEPIVETLILPNKPTFRRYMHRRFFIFRLTDSVTVRRLGEASKRKPGMAIATVLSVVVLLGLLLKISAEFFDIGIDTTPVVMTSNDPALAAPSRLVLATSSRNPNTAAAKLPKPTALLPATSESQPKSQPQSHPAVLAAITPVSAKTGSEAKPEPQPQAMPVAQASAPVVAPVPAMNLDEQQKALENALEESILAMRKVGGRAETYARENEAKIIELQRRIQDLIPVRAGHGFSGSSQSLALSRCLASVHLLGGRRQAARNVLLDLRDTIVTTRSGGDPELRLADYLLRLTEAAPTTDQERSTKVQLPLTPGEMEALLAKFGSDPQWEPPADEAIAGGN